MQPAQTLQHQAGREAGKQAGRQAGRQAIEQRDAHKMQKQRGVRERSYLSRVIRRTDLSGLLMSRIVR